MKKKTGMKIFAGGSRYQNWMRLVSWIRRSVRRRSHRKGFIFSVSGIFSGKAESVALLGTINTQNLIKIVGAIFEKNKIFYFFSREQPLISGVGLWGKLKKRLEIFTREL